MRMFAQDAAFYRRLRVDETDHPEALRRLKQLEAIDRMRERFTLAEALSMMEVGRSTCCERKRRLREAGAKGLVPRSSRPKSHPGRQWTKADARRVLAVRREKPWAGKATIVHDVAERWPERALSEATVGRVLHCQWQSKTARFWQPKTAHIEGGAVLRGVAGRSLVGGLLAILERAREVAAGFASRSASDCRCMERRSSWCWRIR